MLKVLILSFLLISIYALPGFSQDSPNLTVDQMEICTGIEDRQPAGSDTSFVKTVGQLYCFVKVSGQSDSTSISHVWFYDGKEMAKVDLSIKGKIWRTWSSKRIIEEWVGNWKVEVTSNTGDILMTKEFTIK
jgi:hypothetical protein